MKYLIRVLFIMMLALAPAVGACAQGAAQKYDEGVALYKKGNYQEAIKALNESMIVNKSAANKRKCNAMIKKCRAAMKNQKTNKAQSRQDEDLISVRTNLVEFDGSEAAAEIISVTTSGDWGMKLERETDNVWCTLEKSDDHSSLVIKTKQSNQTMAREANIIVFSTKDESHGKIIKVVQSRGKKPVLRVEPAEPEMIDRKGGEILLRVNCVSDTLYDDGRNWTVSKLPDWANVISTKQVVAKEILGVALSKERVEVKGNELSIMLEPNPTKQERVDYIILSSQDTELRVKLTQQKGNKKTGAR